MTSASEVEVKNILRSPSPGRRTLQGATQFSSGTDLSFSVLEREQAEAASTAAAGSNNDLVRYRNVDDRGKGRTGGLVGVYTANRTILDCDHPHSWAVREFLLSSILISLNFPRTGGIPLIHLIPRIMQPIPKSVPSSSIRRQRSARSALACTEWLCLSCA